MQYIFLVISVSYTLCKCVRHRPYIPLYRHQLFSYKLTLRLIQGWGLFITTEYTFCDSASTNNIIIIFWSGCFFSNQIIKPITDDRNGYPYIPAILCDIYRQKFDIAEMTAKSISEMTAKSISFKQEYKYHAYISKIKRSKVVNNNKVIFWLFSYVYIVVQKPLVWKGIFFVCRA